MLRTLATCLFFVLTCSAQEGTRVFLSRCIQCHDSNSDSHAPLPDALAAMPWENIVKALETGSMKAMGAPLSPAERVAVARYLGKAGPVTMPEMTGACAAGAKPVAGAGWTGWSPDLTNTRFQTGKAAGMTAAQVPTLEVAWTFGFPNTTTAYSQPTIAGGRIFTGSNDGTVYALDARSGCMYWRYQAKAMVRSVVLAGPENQVWFGDLESNFYALNAATGKVLWQKKLDSQPFTRITGAPVYHAGRLYVPITSQEETAGAIPSYSCCTFRGNVVALQTKDGKQIWRTFTTPEPKPTRKSKAGVQFYGPSGATIWSAPTLDLKLKVLYVSTGNGYSGPELGTEDAVIALDMDTGAIKWVHQIAPDMFNWGCAGKQPAGDQLNDTNCPENPGIDIDPGGSPVLLDLPNGHQVLVQGRKSAAVHGLDPDDKGKQLWETTFGKGGAGGGIQWGVSYGDGFVFAGLGEAAGGMYAFDPATGKIAWNTPSPVPSCDGKRGCSKALKSPPAVIPGVVFAPAMDGHIRAFETKTGKIIWDFDTVQDFKTVNGIPAKGGSMASTGPTVANGMLYVNSGYSGQPGNVLIAFRIPTRIKQAP